MGLIEKRLIKLGLEEWLPESIKDLREVAGGQQFYEMERIGRANGKKVLNYRYGPVTYYTNGGERFDMCDDGKGAFEFSGGLDVGGKPFALSVNNTP